jgi:electron transfer flavoprotein beta subunit
MNLVACVKQVPSSEARIQIAADGRSIDRTNVEFVINPYDEYAIEEGLRIREKFGGTLTVITIGPQKAEEALRTALALGADRALIIKDEALLGGDCHSIARILAEVIRPLSADLVLCGKSTIDLDDHGVGVALAEILALPHVSIVSRIEWMDDKRIRAVREIEGATEVAEVTIPAVLTANKGLNEPRYPSLPGIMKAKKKPIEEVSSEQLGLDKSTMGEQGSRVEITALEPPPMRSEGKKLAGDPRESVMTVLRALREERKIL